MKSSFLNLIMLGLIISSCNEKVSPDLDNPGATTGDDTTDPDTYVFSVTNTSRSQLNYKLHRTGPGNASTVRTVAGNTKEFPSCSILKTTPFTNDLYRSESATLHDDKAYDITCFFEAEELSLYHSGIDFAVNASKDTCEYVSYSPFSYFQYQPGDSTATLTRVNCSEGVSDLEAQGEASTPTYGAGTKATCGTLVDTNIVVVASRSLISVAEDADLCSYDHTSSDGPNCDKGVITINEINYLDTEGVISQSTSTTEVDCGGKPVNCIAGPIKETTITERTGGSIVTETEKNSDYTAGYSLVGGTNQAPQHYGNYNIANYRRDLANPSVNFIDHFIPATYNAAFAVAGVERYFNPKLMENYAINKRMDGSDIISTFDYDTVYSIATGRTSRPLAADPYMGLSGYRTNPFYTFHCLDRDFDVKARIRMVVRDWDRLYSTTPADIERLTDLVDGVASSRQDNDSEEITGDNDPYNNFNDLYDWDDFLFMERTGGALVDATTIWNPENGFFNANNFVGGSL